ncbi:MAG: hypothetical protein WCR06_10165 [bacterium]
MKKMAFALMALSLVVSIPAVAKDKAAHNAGGSPAAEKPAKTPEPAALQELTLTGRISKAQKTDKKGKTTSSYVLTDPAGQVVKLPTPTAPKAKKGEAAVPAINLDDYVDKAVTIVAKGTETTDQAGAKIVHVKHIVSVTAAGLDAAPAPAAAAPAPAAAPAAPAPAAAAK